MSKKFIKMHGTGNDFLIVQPDFFGMANIRSNVNTFSQEERDFIKSTVIELCKSHFGVGADGILIISQVQNGMYKMSILNAEDCSLGLMCGNGLRCIAAYLFMTKKIEFQQFHIATDFGPMWVKVQPQNSRICYVESNLGYLSEFQTLNQLQFEQDHPFSRYLQKLTPYTCVLGYIHVIIYLSQDQFKAIQADNAYLNISEYLRKQRKGNVNFCLAEPNSVLRLVTCELGVGVTYACGTGSTASSYVGYRVGLLEKKVTVKNKGGELTITIEPREQNKYEVHMDGPAEYVFSGYLDDTPQIL